MIRLFFAHPKDLEGLDDAVKRLTRASKTAHNNRSIQVVTAKDDWTRMSAARGGWSDWQASVAGLSMGLPRFDVVVVGDGTTGKIIGRGTAGIVDACLSKGRDLIWWNGDATFIRGTTFKQVIGRRNLPHDNWQAYAEVILG